MQGVRDATAVGRPASLHAAFAIRPRAARIRSEPHVGGGLRPAPGSGAPAADGPGAASHAPTRCLDRSVCPPSVSE